jgi:hypothetical protein
MKFWKMLCLCCFAWGKFGFIGYAQLQRPQSTDWNGYLHSFTWLSGQTMQSTIPLQTYLSTSSPFGLGIQWTIDIELTFNPTTANQLRIHLVSDQENLLEPHRGYMIQLGETGNSDRYHLYRLDQESSTLLMSTPPLQRNQPAHIREELLIKRDSNGYWQMIVETADGLTESSPILLDTTFKTSHHMGFSCHFTSANSNRFSVHHFSVDSLNIPLAIPPKDKLVVDSLWQVGPFGLALRFNLPLDSFIAVQTERFEIRGNHGNPSLITKQSDYYVLDFSTYFEIGTYTLYLDSLLVMPSQSWQKHDPISFQTYFPPPAEIIIPMAPDAIPPGAIIKDFDHFNPQEWSGDVTQVTVQDGLLGLISGAQSPVRLSLQQQDVLNRVWEFGVEIKKELTANNYIRFYMSANEPIDSSHQGYHVQLDGSNKQYKWRIYRQNGTSRSTLFETASFPIPAAGFRGRVRIVCDLEGTWTLAMDTLGDGPFIILPNLQGQLQWSNRQFTFSEWSGLAIYSTSTRTSDFKWHYVLIHGGTDPTPHLLAPPLIENHSINEAQQLVLRFARKPDSLGALHRHKYQLANSGQQPSSIFWFNEALYLSFENTPIGPQRLNLLDLPHPHPDGPGLDTTLLFHWELYRQPIPGELIINEVMTQPKENGSLPFSEYIELYNPTNYTFSIKNFQWVVNSRNMTILNDQLIGPGQFLVFGPSSAASHWEGNDSFIPLSNWLALHNEELELRLLSDKGQIMDQAQLYKYLHNLPTKRNGGWSFERISSNYTCYTPLNWASSEHPEGGTPGRINSIQSNELPEITIQTEIINGKTIQINFSADIQHLREFRIEDIQVYEAGLTVGEVERISASAILLHFTSPIPSGHNITLTLETMDLCTERSQLFRTAFLQSEIPSTGDVLLNEILFDPKTGGSEFIELYNTSQHAFDLKKFSLIALQSSGKRQLPIPVVADSWLLLPQQYALISNQPTQTMQHYPLTKMESVRMDTRLPTLRNSGGSILLLYEGEVIDSLPYTPSMHDRFLTNTKGISLERRHIHMPTDEASNWHSASTLHGGATPGYRNSQYTDTTFSRKEPIELRLLSPNFSPDHDGFEDVLQLQYTCDFPGYMLRLDIINDNGLRIQTNIRHALIGMQGQIEWDGNLPNGRKIQEGLYVLHAQVYHSNGWEKVIRLPFYVVGHRFR